MTFADIVYIYIYILQLTYTNKNLLYTAGASRMVCKSAYLGPCSYIGPKRPIKNKKLFRVYGKVLYTERRLSAHSYLYICDIVCVICMHGIQPTKGG